MNRKGLEQSIRLWTNTLIEKSRAKGYGLTFEFDRNTGKGFSFDVWGSEEDVAKMRIECQDLKFGQYSVELVRKGDYRTCRHIKHYGAVRAAFRLISELGLRPPGSFDIENFCSCYACGQCFSPDEGIFEMHWSMDNLCVSVHIDDIDETRTDIASRFRDGWTRPTLSWTIVRYDPFDVESEEGCKELPEKVVALLQEHFSAERPSNSCGQGVMCDGD